ncbi:MAG: acyltransferase family protein [Oscillospiraceae bacterium]|nr:acyltransferase family protein [Oscillospiraceae bacterium]
MRKREGYLDVLRCLAIAMVLLNHCVSRYIRTPAYYGTRTFVPLLMLNALSNIGVPLFLMISGCLMLESDSSRDIAGFYKKRLPRILLALIVWNVVYYVGPGLLRGRALSAGGFFEELINAGSAYHLWFLYLIAGIYLLTPFLKRVVDSCTGRQCWLLLLLMLLCPTIRPFLNQTFGIYINLFEPLFNGYIGYFLLGYLLGRTELRRWMGPAALAAFAAGFLLAVTQNYRASSPDGVQTVYNYGASITQYLMASAVFVSARLEIRGNGRLALAAEHGSRLTFGVYVLHLIVLELLWERGSPDTTPLLLIAYLFFVTLVVSFLLSWLLNRIPVVKKVVS